MIAPTRREWLSILIVCAAVVIAALPTLTYPLGRDQGEFATIARALLDGRIPYVDIWNPKPPAVFVVYGMAMAAFGRTAEAIRLIDLIVMPPALIALWWIGRRMIGHIGGLAAAALCAFFYFTETFWTLTQNDGIVLLPMTLAAACALKAADRGRGALAWAGMAGALCGVVVWFKYPFALFVGVIALYLLVVCRWRPLAAFMLGGALVIGGGALQLVARGAWDAFIESARVTAGYTALTLNPADVGAALRIALDYRWAHWGLLFVFAAFGMLRLWRNRAVRRDRWAFALAWLLASVGIMLAQGKGYDYHWLPMLPPLALLGGFGMVDLSPKSPPKLRGNVEESDLDPYAHSVLKYDRQMWARRTKALPTRLRQSAVIPMLGTAALLIGLGGVLYGRTLPYLFGAEDRLTYFSRFQGGEFLADESARMVQFLRERVVPGDSLFIWGFRPEVYYLSGLNPAGRFIFQYPLVGDWYPAAWRQQAVDVLWAALPPYVLVLQVDYLPWVTGSHDDSNTLLQQYPALNDWLIYHYAPEAQIGNFLVWRRMSSP